MGLATNDLVQVVYAYRSQDSGDRFFMVLHERVVVPDPTSNLFDDLEEIANYFGDKLAISGPCAKLIACLANNVFLDYVQAQRVYPVRTVYRRKQIDTLGSWGGPASTFNIATSITKRTNTPGRKGIGRVQLGGVPAEVIQNGYIGDEPYRENVDDLANALFFTHPIKSPLSTHGCLPGTPSSELYDIDDYEIQPTARTMHRRTVGLGI